MLKKIAVFIDGGFLREIVKEAKLPYNPDFIERFAHACKAEDEELFRILYYDCGQYSGTVTLPISNKKKVFTANDAWLHELAYKDLFAVRRGELKFRGYKRKPLRSTPGQTDNKPTGDLTDDDFYPDFEQKGVDMRIGLDVALYSANQFIDRVVLVSGDTDCIPALKHARKAGLQTILIQPGGRKLVKDLLAHGDLRRDVILPDSVTNQV